jgi:RNA polymerase sigma-70 factor (ECF subfamily)
VLTRIEDCIPSLRRYAWALLRNRQDADDLVHDTLVRALDHLPQRREDADLRAWLFTIMHNLFVSQLRRLKTRRDAVNPDHFDDTTIGPHAVQEDRLRWRDLLRGLDSLPEEQRTVILLVSVEDLSYGDVARVLGIPIGTVMSRLSRGRERLRQLTHEDARPSLRRVK